MISFQITNNTKMPLSKKRKWTRKNRLFKYNRRFYCIEWLIHYNHVEISIENFRWCQRIFKNKNFACISYFSPNTLFGDGGMDIPSHIAKFSYGAYFAIIDKLIPSSFSIIRSQDPYRIQFRIFIDNIPLFS